MKDEPKIHHFAIGPPGEPESFDEMFTDANRVSALMGALFAAKDQGYAVWEVFFEPTFVEIEMGATL